MSKKKNTLEDLNEFLKQQAATLVSPEKLSEKVEEQKPAPQQPAIAQQQTTQQPAATEITFDKLLHDLKTLSEQEGVFFRKKFYEVIVKTIEAQHTALPEDKMLINTALYLQAGNDWKDVIREYWRRKAADQK